MVDGLCKSVWAPVCDHPREHKSATTTRYNNNTNRNKHKAKDQSNKTKDQSTRANNSTTKHKDQEQGPTNNNTINNKQWAPKIATINNEESTMEIHQ